MARKRFRTIKLVAAALVAGLFSTHAAHAATPLTTINGTVSDNAGGSGVAKVDAYLLRTNGGADQYWANRSGVWGWGASVTAIPTTLSGGGWSVTASSPASTSFPSGANWLDGTYRVKATAFDVAGNSATSTVNTFVVDSVAPSAIAITAPVNGSGLKTLTAINGTVTDNAGGSGIAKVDVYLYRIVSGVTQYWANRSGAWGWGALAPFPATLYSTSWGVSSTGTVSPAGTQLPSGVNFADGNYFIKAIATDRAGNTLQSAANTFTASSDSVVPDSVIVVAPANGSGLKTLTAINGTATDNAGGAGIGRVDVYLYRVVSGVTQYWGNRSGVWGWGGLAVIPAAVYTTSWGISTTGTVAPAGTQLPSGADFPDGNYFVKAIGYDKAGNSKQSTTSTFTASSDSVVPDSVIVLAPANGSGLKTLTAINGTATDNAGGIGIGKVDVYLYRVVSGVTQYWGNRSGVWGWGGVALIPAAVYTTSWGISTTGTVAPAGTQLPSGVNFPDGNYYVKAIGYDKAGNSKQSATSIFTASSDSVVPASVVVSSPANGALLTSLTAINGTAADNAGGVGIGRVDAYLYRVVSGVAQYWGNRSGVWGWGGVAVIPAAVYTTSWGISTTGTVAPAGTQLPSGVNLTPGTYYVNARAYDKAGNVKQSTTNTFTVAPSGGQIAGRSSVILSSASASNDLVTLTFSGAISVNSATTLANYGVTVNGEEAIVESASSSKGGVVVTLGFASGTVQTGDKVAIAYDVLDTQGKAVTGLTQVTSR